MFGKDKSIQNFVKRAVEVGPDYVPRPRTKLGRVFVRDGLFVMAYVKLHTKGLADRTARGRLMYLLKRSVEWNR